MTKLKEKDFEERITAKTKYKEQNKERIIALQSQIDDCERENELIDLEVDFLQTKSKNN